MTYKYIIYTMASPTIQTSVNISPDYYDLCKKNYIKFTEAMRVGISVILAEKGIKEYDNKLNLVREFQLLKLKAAQYAQKAADLENGTSN